MEAALKLFKQYDRDGNGTIERIELETVLMALDKYWTRERVEILFHSLDINADGVLSYEEFVAWVSGKGSAMQDLKQLKPANLLSAKAKISTSTLRKADAVIEKEKRKASEAQQAAERKALEAQQAAERAERLKGTVSLTLTNMVSGNCLYGPEVVARTTCVRDFKAGITEPGKAVKLYREGKVLEDNELLGDIASEDDVDLLVSVCAGDVASAELLNTLRRMDIVELRSNKNPTDLARLVLHASFLALCVACGEEVATSKVGWLGADQQWRHGCVLGTGTSEGHPTHIVLYINREDVKVTGIRRKEEWCDNLSLESLIEQLHNLDHALLQQNLRSGVAPAEELRAAMQIEQFTPSQAGKSSGAAKVLCDWLEIFVRPFLHTAGA